MAKLTLVQYPGLTGKTTMSAPCGKVHMALGFKKLEFTLRNVRTPGQARRYNPRGRVPSLLIDGETFVDSSDILTELDRRYPDPPLLPSDAKERARVKVLEDWADENIYFYLLYLRWCVDANFAHMRARFSSVPLPLRWFLPTIARRIAVRRARAQGVGLKDESVVQRELGECLEALDALVQPGPFLVGDRPTRADLSVGAVIDQLRVEELTPDAAAAVNRHAAVVAWIERVHQHVPNVAIKE